MTGVFISRGMTVTVPAGGLTLGIGDHGNVTGHLTLHVRFDVCPTWSELALRHLEDAKAKRAAREAAWAGSNEEHKAATLEREFEASMQAIMAATIAIDAFYAIIQTHVQLPTSLINNQWRTKRTSRYAQVTEVLRRAFQLKPKGTAALRRTSRRSIGYAISQCILPARSKHRSCTQKSTLVSNGDSRISAHTTPNLSSMQRPGFFGT